MAPSSGSPSRASMTKSNDGGAGASRSPVTPSTTAATPGAKPTGPLSNPAEASPGATPGKRKIEENRASTSSQSGQSHPAKRNKYVPNACNECKRRKIKCNGYQPCARCGKLALACVYVSNHPGKSTQSQLRLQTEMHRMNDEIRSLQDQVNQLRTSIESLRKGSNTAAAETQTPSAASESGRRRHNSRTGNTPGSAEPCRGDEPKHPRFQGRTTSAYGFDLAKSSLEDMGIHAEHPSEESQPTTPAAASPSPLTRNDPLMQISRDDVIKLCRTYYDEMGFMYPVFEPDYFSKLFAGTEEGASAADVVEMLSGEDGDIIRVAAAIGLVVEGSEQRDLDLGRRLFDSVRDLADRILWDASSDLKRLAVLVLIGMYHFHIDDEVLSWRTIRVAAGLCLELGIHRRETLLRNFPEEEEQNKALKIFWVVYILDRRWSFGTGLPFSLRDSDIDPTLPEPESTFLQTMISYGRLTTSVWDSIMQYSKPSDDFREDETGYLDYKLIQWLSSVPPELKYSPTDDLNDTSQPRTVRRSRVVLYLRANQMRILAYRQVLLSSKNIQNHPAAAHLAVDIAKDTIRVLTAVNRTSDLYRTQQMLFNYFLSSSLAVLFLAVAHAPLEFKSLCKEEFNLALNLVKGLSNNSRVSRRLWKAIGGLKQMAARIGLRDDNNNGNGNSGHHHQHRATSTAPQFYPITTSGPEMFATPDAAVTMPTPQNPQAFADMDFNLWDEAPNSGFHMSNELNNLFRVGQPEVYGDQQQPQPIPPQQSPPQQTVTPGGTTVPLLVNGGGAYDGGPAVSADTFFGFGNDDEVSRILRELF